MYQPPMPGGVGYGTGVYIPAGAPGTGLPGQGMGYGSPNLGFLGSPRQELVQEAKCSKAWCSFCITEDIWDAGVGVVVREESTCFERNIMFWYLPCLGKEFKYHVTVNGQYNQYTIDQERECTWTSGRTMKLYDQSNKLGTVGLPCNKVCCNCDYGCIFCLATGPLFYNSFVRYAPFFAGLMAQVHLNNWCCTGCRTFPSLVMNERDDVVFRIWAPICQMSMWFGSIFPCDPCRTTEFEIVPKDSSMVIGGITRYNNASCICLPFHTASKFTLNLPPMATQQERALLFAGAMSLYQLYFDV